MIAMHDAGVDADNRPGGQKLAVNLDMPSAGTTRGRLVPTAGCNLKASYMQACKYGISLASSSFTGSDSFPLFFRSSISEINFSLHSGFFNR
jgi:hypothetical protein